MFRNIFYIQSIFLASFNWILGHIDPDLWLILDYQPIADSVKKVFLSTDTDKLAHL